jgi:hypothetical protein
MTLPLVDDDLAPLEPAAGAEKFTEDQARAWLAENGNAAKPVREIAAVLGWSRSTTQRFLSGFRSGTDLGQSAKPAGQTLETPGTSGTDGTSETAPDFDWSPKNGDIAVPGQRALAVYANAYGQLVIRVQADAYDDDGDPFIAVSREHVPKLIERMRAVLAELEADGA